VVQAALSRWFSTSIPYAGGTDSCIRIPHLCCRYKQLLYKSTPYAGGTNSCFLISTSYAGGTNSCFQHQLPTLVVHPYAGGISLTPPTSPRATTLINIYEIKHLLINLQWVVLLVHLTIFNVKTLIIHVHAVFRIGSLVTHVVLADNLLFCF